MTKSETRKLGIEFERRIRTMFPQEEVLEKLDTDTIFSMLNEYLMTYTKQLLMLMNSQLQQNATILSVINKTLDSLLSSELLDCTEVNDYEMQFTLPERFGAYLRSYSNATNKVTKRSGILENTFMSDADYMKSVPTIQDRGKIIRNPIVHFNGETVGSVLHDQYTTIDSIQMHYYRYPVRFNVLGPNTECELPIECFEDLVAGAVELYVSKYKLGIRPKESDQKKKEENE